MADLISRAALLKECAECQKTDPRFEERGWANHFINDAGEPSTEWYCVEDIIENAPAVDAVPVVWVAINGFEGLYEISNFGRVRNRNGEVLKQRIKRTNCTCYKTVDLWKDGRYYKKYIHRLVADAFIPNPNNMPFVNHKDEDGTNNFIDNLEWCTREYNVNYGTAKERRAKKIRGVLHTEEHK